MRVRNLEALRKWNADNARCVSWVLRNITDPEAIDSAIRLASTIRWFYGGPDQDPPFDLIVSALEGCSDGAKQLYPGKVGGSMIRSTSCSRSDRSMTRNLGNSKKTHSSLNTYYTNMWKI
jgi:hypothetical protein